MLRDAVLRLRVLRFAFFHSFIPIPLRQFVCFGGTRLLISDGGITGSGISSCGSRDSNEGNCGLSVCNSMTQICKVKK